MTKKINDQPTIDSNYIQQHQANERTFLAWIRTAIAILGVGFLVTNLHFTLQSNAESTEDFLISAIGVGSVGLGILTIVIAVISYLKKIKAINHQTFRASTWSVIFLGLFICAIAILFGLYFIQL